MVELLGLSLGVFLYASDNVSVRSGDVCESHWVPYESMIVSPIHGTEKQQYTVELGLFYSDKEARHYSNKFDGIGPVTMMFKVIDAKGTKWNLLTAGVFDSADDAHKFIRLIDDKVEMGMRRNVLRLPEMTGSDRICGRG